MYNNSAEILERKKSGKSKLLVTLFGPRFGIREKNAAPTEIIPFKLDMFTPPGSLPRLYDIRVNRPQKSTLNQGFKGRPKDTLSG